jgi:hypothetical protein
MYRDEDVLLRSIRKLAEAIARWTIGARPAQAEIDATVREATGLSLSTLDVLPPEALVGAFGADDLGRARLAAIADLLAALAEPGPAGESRRAKAAALREALSPSGR